MNHDSGKTPNARGIDDRLRVIAVLAIALALAWPACAAAQTVVVLVFDGFTPRMVEAHPTPVLDGIRAEGAWTHAVEPVFPTMSLPNHVSLSTGCWPARHGIVSNMFRDPARGAYDHERDADWLYACEHLHEVAERQGVRTAALGWVGARSTRRGPLASLIEPEYAPDTTRGRQVVELLGLPAEQRPSLILAYFEGPDEAAHYKGIESKPTRRAVQQSDAILGDILTELRRLRRAGESATLLVTTDHGMREVRTIVNVQRLLRSEGIDARFSSSGTTSFLYFDDPADIAPAAQALSKYSQFDVYRRADIPAGWNLGESDRLGDLVLSAKPPYFIEDIALWPRWVRWLGRIGPKFIWARPVLKASHGYPPDTPGMHGLLYAWGDGIAAGEIGPVRAIDLHPTVTTLLGIENGSLVDGAIIAGLLQLPR